MSWFPAACSSTSVRRTATTQSTWSGRASRSVNRPRIPGCYQRLWIPLLDARAERWASALRPTGGADQATDRPRQVRELDDAAASERRGGAPRSRSADPIRRPARVSQGNGEAVHSRSPAGAWSRRPVGGTPLVARPEPATRAWSRRCSSMPTAANGCMASAISTTIPRWSERSTRQPALLIKSLGSPSRCTLPSDHPRN